MRPWLAARAERDPDGIALRHGGRETTFARLARRVDLLARRLATMGVGPGRRVALRADPSVRWVEVVHAVQRLGATLMPIATRLAPAEAHRLLARGAPHLALHGAGYAAPRAARALELETLDDVEPASPAVLVDDLDPDDVHSILFTSGTTGDAKGAMLTHAAHLASARASATRLATTAADRWLVCMPLHHVGGLAVLLRGVVTGFAIVVQERFDARAVRRAIVEEGVTMLSVVPTMLARLLDVAGGPESLEGLRGILTGGGPLPEPLRRRCVAGGLPIAVTYGLTEACSQVATAAPGTEAVRALEGVDLRIAGPEADGVGEIVVRGPMVMKGYLDDEDATRGALRGGWLHTGDLGRLSADGSLTVAGRRTDLVVTGGENVYPVEVERVLERHPGIAEVAVFGLPDHEWGERVVAAIVPSRGMLDAQELTEWCRGHLAAFKVPREIRMVPALPRSPSGKLRRTDLATLA